MNKFNNCTSSGVQIFVFPGILPEPTSVAELTHSFLSIESANNSQTFETPVMKF